MNREQKRIDEKKNLGRAKLLWQRDLAWTVGFPLDLVLHGNSNGPTQGLGQTRSAESLDWFRVDSLERPDDAALFQVDRDVLRRSVLAASKLRRDFSKFVDQIFCEPDKWFSRFDWITGILHEAIRASLSTPERNTILRKMLDQATMRSLMQTVGDDKRSHQMQHSSLALLRQILYSVQLAESMLPKTPSIPLKKWLANQGDELKLIFSIHPTSTQRLPCRLDPRHWEIMVLTQLRSSLVDTERFRTIRKLLTSHAVSNLHHPDPNWRITQLANRCREILGVPHDSKEVIQPSPDSSARKTIRQTLTGSLVTALRAKPQRQQAIVAAICNVGSPQWLKRLQHFADKVATQEQRLQLLLSNIEFRPTFTVKSNMITKHYAAQIASEPLSQSEIKMIADMVTFLERLSTDSMPPELLRPVSGYLNSIGKSWLLGLRLVNKLLESLDGKGWESPQRQENLIAIFSGLLAISRRTGKGSELSRLISPSFFADWLPTKDWTGCIKVPPKEHRVSLKKLWLLTEELTRASRAIGCHRVIRAIPSLSRSGVAPSFAVKILEKLQAISRTFREHHGDIVSKEEIEVILRYVSTPDDFIVALIHFEDEEIDNAWDALEVCQKLRPLAENPVGKLLVKTWLCSGKWSPAILFARLLSGIEDPETTLGNIGEANPIPDWIMRYPGELKEGCTLLNLVTAAAQNIAKDVLSPSFVDSEKHERELLWLDARLADEHLAETEKTVLHARREKLRQQLGSFRMPTVRRLKNLNCKLIQRALFEYEHQLRKKLTDQWCQTLPEFLRKPARDRISDDLFCRVVLGISQLSEYERSWGWELLRLSLTGDTFPEMNYSENQTFIARLAEAGTHPQPWLDLGRKLVYQAEDGHSMQLSFASDPMDYLLMGYHFRTCLSPEHGNFFSTISNAIDVNKRVIYARDQFGQVLGRCLVALTAEGQLVRFEAYAHSDNRNFEAAVQQFINQLLCDMKTTLSVEGSVPKLVATQWYDDGAIGADGQRVFATDPLVVRDNRFEQLLKQSHLSEQEQQEWFDLAEQIARDYGDEWLIKQMESGTQEWTVRYCLDFLIKTKKPVSSLLIFAHQMLLTNRPVMLTPTLDHIPVKSLISRFRQSVCAYPSCFKFHGIGEYDATNSLAQEIINRVDPSLGVRLLRTSRKRFVRSDLQEVDQSRREMLAKCHEKLGRSDLARKLRSGPTVEL